MKKIEIDINELKTLYLSGEYTQRDLATHFCVSVTMINKRLKAHNITKYKPTEDFLYEHYIEKNMTQEGIGKILGISAGSVGSYLRKFKIKKPSKIEENAENIVRLFEEGKTYYAISKELNCSISTVYAVLEKEGLKKATKEYNELDKELLSHLYLELDYTLEEVAKTLKKSITCVNRHILAYGIVKPNKIQIDIDYVKDLYLNKNLKQYEIANILGIKLTTLQSLLKRHDIIRNMSDLDLEELTKLCKTELSIQEIAAKIGYSRTYVGQVIQKNGIFRESYNKETSIERFIKYFLNDSKVIFEQNERKILGGKELDFYIPSINMGIEVCGLYWHSTKINPNKHHIYDKYKLAASKNVELITIFEDEIINKPDIVVNRLKTKLSLNTNTVYARNTCAELINPREGIDFLNLHHIQGAGKNNIYLGLKQANSLIAVMSFSHSNIAKGLADVEWELNRFASKGVVVGGASKLLNFFKQNFNPESIISYSDNRWNNGAVYSKLGFTLSHESKPNYWYVVNQERKHRFSFTKHKLLELYPDATKENTEEEIAESHNLYRVYDCGNKVFEWRLT